ncbi:hypothetical protein [Streptomyces rubradiris]|uniref:hypothetical protein n=1 Tax=Streptomyces rubradiris TaxID=285531 RepID=UPI001676A2F1|nr:hypothetical protein [Streptomyces rubradiris]GHH25612.1 hypothetical protein GCM10018792_64800 [Streptomyces rubradiris]
MKKTLARLLRRGAEPPTAAEARTAWTWCAIRPVDLRPRDFAFLGRWVEVLDVYTSPEDFNPDGYGEARCKEVLEPLNEDDLYVVVRYLVEETYAEGGDGISVLRRADLVCVQIPETRRCLG